MNSAASLNSTAGPNSALGASREPLARAYDTALYDLDGVLYIGAEPVAHAVDAVTAALAAGQRAVYVTNNASRTPEVVAQHLAGFGLPATANDVVTSATATAVQLRAWVPVGARVLAVGGEGVAAALSEAGFEPIDPLQAGAIGVVDAVVMGFGPDLGWRHLAAASAAVRRGVPFIATNADRTVPTPTGPAPGNGMLVEAVTAASREPDAVVGKPQPAMFVTAARLADATRPLVIGDRLDTDIEGAFAAGLDSLLVLTGVTRATDVIAAAPPHRPTYLAADLRGLLEAHQAPERDSRGWRLGGWSAYREADVVVVEPGVVEPVVVEPAVAEPVVEHAATSDVTSDTVSDLVGRPAADGVPGVDPIDAVRVACAASWDLPHDRWTPPTEVVGLPLAWVGAIASPGAAE